MTEDATNKLISIKPSDSPIAVSLHPLVLLTASDLLTRHRLRKESGPLAGILLGQQNGQTVTAEHAFPANLVKDIDGHYILSQAWTEARIQQFKDVHKAPPLDVVGWFTTCPVSWPLPEHVHIQQQLVKITGDHGIFLAIHPAEMSASDTTNRKLPISIYEGLTEGESLQEESKMAIDGEELGGIRFRPVSYTIDTDEAEMIGIDYVAKGAGSAASVSGSVKTASAPAATENRGKQKASAMGTDAAQMNGDDKFATLTTEEEDQLAGMTTRLNSVKMLLTRIQLMQNYAQTIPPSYLSTLGTTYDTFPPSEHLPHLRNLQALVTRLSLLTPTQEAGTTISQPITKLSEASQSQNNDVALATMLSQLGQDVQALHELGRKFATVEQGRNSKGKGRGGFGGSGAMAGMDDNDGKMNALDLTTGMLV